MGRTWTLTFGQFPPGPNDRLHYQDRAGRVKRWRWATWAQCREQTIPPLGRVRISAVFYRKRIGQADADNDAARLKPVADGIVDAGVVPNDTRQYVQWGEVREERGTPLLAIIIEELDA